MHYKLICFDMDGVIFELDNFWVALHKKLGTWEKGKLLTEKYLHTDYNKLVEEVVVGLWKGKSADKYFELINEEKYMSGFDSLIKFIKKEKLKTAIITGGSIHLANRVDNDYGIDYIFSNELVIENNIITGEFKWPIAAGKEKKAEIIRNLCAEIKVDLSEVVYIGDSDQDIEAFHEVGLAIAFNTQSLNLIQASDAKVENLTEVIDLIKSRKLG